MKPSPRNIYSIVILFMIVSVPFLSLVPMAKANPTLVSLDPASTTGLLPGDTFSVNVMIADDVVDLKSWQFNIAFSGTGKGVLEATEVIQGDFLMIGGETYFTSNIDNPAGEVRAAANIIGAVPGVSGAGLLATVIFKVIGGGESPLHLFDTILLDSSGTPITHDTADGNYVGAAPYAFFTYRPSSSLDGYLPVVNQSITFNATGSYDPNGGSIDSYKWYFDALNVSDVPVVTTQPIIQHAYSKATGYVVNLTVTSSSGYTDLYSDTTVDVWVRDVAVQILSVSPGGLVKAGTPISIELNATNIGTGSESFNITTFANDIPINITDAVNLPPIPAPYQPPFFHIKLFTVTWDTTGLPTDVYTIKAVATTFPEGAPDNNMTNNEYVWGNITISLISRLVYDVTTYGKVFKVGLETNSTVTGLEFDYSNKRIAFNAEGPAGLFSYANLTIPMNMLNVSDPASWIVELNATSTDFTATSNGTHYFAYFDYTFAGLYIVSIIGSKVPIPPQPTFTISPTKGTVGQPMTFDASLTTDPEGHGIKEYFWWVFTSPPKGGRETVWSKTTTEPTVSVVFNQSYVGVSAPTVTVTATNNFGMANESAAKELFVLWPYDIAVVDIEVPQNSVNIGQDIFINVTVTSLLETPQAQVKFRVTIYGNDTMLTTFLVDPLIQPPEIFAPAVGLTTWAVYKWNETNVPGSYTIKVNASVVGYTGVVPPLPPEVNVADNMFTYGLVTVTKWNSIVNMVASPSTLNYGQETIMSGSVSPLRAGVNVTLQWRQGSSTAWKMAGIVKTGVQGTYLFNWKPPSAGTYDVRVIWGGDSITLGNASAIKTLTVRKTGSTLVADASSTSANVGSAVTISGTITPAMSGVTVTISVNKDGSGWTTAGTATTDASGNYDYDWTPNEAGTYQVKATWAGDVNTLESESDIKTVTVSSTGLGDLYIYIAVGVIIVVAVVAAVFFVMRRKK